MSKEIWLPDSKTHVLVEDGRVKVWDSMIMSKQELEIEKKGFGFNTEMEEYFDRKWNKTDV